MTEKSCNFPRDGGLTSAPSCPWGYMLPAILSRHLADLSKLPCLLNGSRLGLDGRRLIEARRLCCVCGIFHSTLSRGYG